MNQVIAQDRREQKKQRLEIREKPGYKARSKIPKQVEAMD